MKDAVEAAEIEVGVRDVDLLDGERRRILFLEGRIVVIGKRIEREDLVSPRIGSCFVRCDPMKPAAPVTTYFTDALA